MRIPTLNTNTLMPYNQIFVLNYGNKMSGRVTSAWASARAQGMYLDRFSRDWEWLFNEAVLLGIAVFYFDIE